VHTSALPTGNHTTDARIAEIADGESRVVVTKDRDFRDGHLLSGSPRRLLIVATGNITNTELLALFQANLDAIVAALSESDFVELGPRTLVIHERPDRGTSG
jgi:predicted nuclease of predicted toxin-antitoxin system